MPFRSGSARSSCSRRDWRARERGTSAVELALVLPILVLLLFGIFDLGRAFLQQHALTAASREGARLAIAARPVTTAEVEARVQTYLDDAHVQGASISVDPAPEDAASGASIGVEAEVAFSMTILPVSWTLRGTATMVKE